MDAVKFLQSGCVVVIAIFVVGGSERLGDVHTSVAHVSELVKAENGIVRALEKYLDKEETRLKAIHRYVDEWNSADGSAIVSNPLNGYHFLKRLSNDFKQVETAVSGRNSEQVSEILKNIRTQMSPPSEVDVNGAAWALVRLQDIYNLTFDDLIRGTIHGEQAVKGLTAVDCFRFGEQSFKNLEFDLSEKWTETGLSMMKLEGRPPAAAAAAEKIRKIEEIIDRRRIMRNLMTQVAVNSTDEIVDRFSGLGIPTSFQKLIHQKEEASSQISEIENSYRMLCRSEGLQGTIYDKGLSCRYIRGKKWHYRLLMPFKIELLWPDPIVVVYHDLLTHEEADTLRTLAYPKLETTQVHSFTSHKAMKSLARVGKTAWVRRGEDSQVDKILRRVEQMSGLSTETSEDFHILNYGIGGHYDVHVDFFDLHAKKSELEYHRGDRITTALFYLNDVEAGGATVFPSLGLRVPPKKGSVLLWFNLKRNGLGDYRTVHASCPVLLGQKWIANLWLHEFGQEFSWPCKLNPDE